MLSYTYFLMGAFLVGCLLQPSEMACIHGGKVYNNNDPVPVDSCNTCRCAGNQIICTRMACPEHHGMCRKNGIWYNNGSAVPSDDCNTCVCSDGSIVCTLMACTSLQ